MLPAWSPKIHFLPFHSLLMEYSAYDIANARSLQTLSYIYMSMATFWTYDHVCLLATEWRFLLLSRWTKVKALWIVTRYMPALLLISHIYLNFTPNTDPDKCMTLTIVSSAFSLASFICSGLIFILRTYALWNRNRTLLTIVLLAFFGVLIASGSIMFAATSPYILSPIPSITGCYQISNVYLIAYILLSVHELALLSLTLTRAVHKWRTSNSTLFVMLLKHDIFYYACSMVFSVANVLSLRFLHFAYNTVFQDFQVVILAILSTRMHLHLWVVDQKRRIADASPVLIHLNNMADASHTNVIVEDHQRHGAVTPWH